MSRPKRRLISEDSPRERPYYLSRAAAPNRIPFPRLVRARFLERPNRFLVIARVGRRSVRAASRDPGRLSELLRPGAELRLAPSSDPRRRTAYTLVLVRQGRRWISLVPALANEILAAALGRGGIPGLEGARILRREIRRGHSRLDFLLSHRGYRVLTEVKSVTFVTSRRALFPDAPTARGTRHLKELSARRRRGGRALVVFVVQRADADCVSPHRENDPEFASALEDAARAGVRLLAYTCRVSPSGCVLDRRIPVVLCEVAPAGIARGASGRC